MEWYYQYCVTFWNDDEGQMCTRSGVLCADSFKDAAEKLSKYYGEDQIQDITRLYPFLEGSVLEFDTARNEMKGVSIIVED